MLELAFEPRETSRLGCQLRLRRGPLGSLGGEGADGCGTGRVRVFGLYFRPSASFFSTDQVWGQTIVIVQELGKNN